MPKKSYTPEQIVAKFSSRLRVLVADPTTGLRCPADINRCTAFFDIGNLALLADTFFKCVAEVKAHIQVRAMASLKPPPAARTLQAVPKDRGGEAEH